MQHNPNDLTWGSVSTPETGPFVHPPSVNYYIVVHDVVVLKLVRQPEQRSPCFGADYPVNHQIRKRLEPFDSKLSQWPENSVVVTRVKLIAYPIQELLEPRHAWRTRVRFC
jgi:hypothetical protein